MSKLNVPKIWRIDEIGIFLLNFDDDFVPSDVANKYGLLSDFETAAPRTPLQNPGTHHRVEIQL